MEIREIQAFLRAAEFQSMSKAATSLGYTQAAVTIQIRQLEKSLNTRLFDRVGNKISLTEQGKIFYSYATTILKEIELAKDALSEEKTPSGSLVLGTIESICASIFPPLLKKYHDLYPQVNVNVITGSPNELLQQMDDNFIDIVYFMDQKKYNTLWTKVIEAPTEILFVASAHTASLSFSSNPHTLDPKSHPSTPDPHTLDPIPLAQLIKEPFLLTEKDASYRYVLDQHLAAQGLKIRPFLESGNTDFVIKRLVQENAVSFLPKFSVQEYIKNGTLVNVPVSDFQLNVWRQVVYRNDRYITSEMKAFMELVQQEEQLATL